MSKLVVLHLELASGEDFTNTYLSACTWLKANPDVWAEWVPAAWMKVPDPPERHVGTDSIQPLPSCSCLKKLEQAGPVAISGNHDPPLSLETHMYNPVYLFKKSGPPP